MGISQSLCGNRSHSSPSLNSYADEDIEDLFDEHVLPLPEPASSRSLCQKSYRTKLSTSHNGYSSSSSSSGNLKSRYQHKHNSSHSSVRTRLYFEDTDESSAETNSPAYSGEHCTSNYYKNDSHSQFHLNYTRVEPRFHRHSTTYSNSFSSPTNSDKSPVSEYRSIFYQETDCEASSEEGFTPIKPHFSQKSVDDLPSTSKLWIPKTNLDNNYICAPRPTISHSRSYSFLETSTQTPHPQSQPIFSHYPSRQYSAEYRSLSDHSVSSNLHSSTSAYSFQTSCSTSSLQSLDEEEPLEELEETCATITPMCELPSPETCSRTAFSFMRSISSST